MSASLVGSEMCIRDSGAPSVAHRRGARGRQCAWRPKADALQVARLHVVGIRPVAADHRPLGRRGSRH
eukprot:5347762-Alexandrium_andersonii.AAC.1